MSRIPNHTLESAPSATHPVLEQLIARSPRPGIPINMTMRSALDEFGTFDRKTRTALLLTVAAADRCAYTVALNSLLARQSGWSAEETRARRDGRLEDASLTALVTVARQSATNHGQVESRTWQAALDAGWPDAQLAEAFGFIGLTQYVDSFINYAQTEIDPPFAQQSPDGTPLLDQDTRLTFLLIVEDQDRTRAFYEHVLRASVAREHDPVILQFHNSWIVADVGGGPTDDKPEVWLARPSQPDVSSYALNIRVADARSTYTGWTARGAHFLTAPVQRDGEIRCYLRDPDGHLIEVGQSVTS